MHMFLQRTIKHEIACRSIGLHSGRKVGMVFRPAGVDEGIVFVRGDLSGNNRIKAVGRSGDKIIQDQCVWVYKAYAGINFLIWFLRFGIIPFCVIMILAIPILFVRSFGKRKKVKLKILYRILFFILAIIFIILLAVFIFGLKYDVNIFDYSLI